MSGRKKGEITLRDALKEKDPPLYHRLQTIWVEARGLQESQCSKGGHHHGTLHCEAVEDILGKLISDEEKDKRFLPLELFLLSAAACYHDVGKSGDFEEEHGVVAMKDFLERATQYGLTIPEGRVLSYIIGSHNSDKVFDGTPDGYPVGNDSAKVRLLSAIFRLADVMHAYHSRIQNIIVGETKKEDDEKTRFRKLIQGWDFDNESQIKFGAITEKAEDYYLIEKGVSMMRKQIEYIVPCLQLAGFPHKINIWYDSRTSDEEAVKKAKRVLLEMDFYTEDEEAIFEGREKESKELAEMIVGSCVSLLVGNSGVGKTSLIQAGLFPIAKIMNFKYVWTRPLNPDPLRHILNDINAKLLNSRIFRHYVVYRAQAYRI